MADPPAKLNCWEYKKCGRECMGGRIKELGICPAAISIKANGINGGNCGGRACWALVGTFCGGAVQATDADKFATCRSCGFFQLVAAEEGAQLASVKEIRERTA